MNHQRQIYLIGSRWMMNRLFREVMQKNINKLQVWYYHVRSEQRWNDLKLTVANLLHIKIMLIKNRSIKFKTLLLTFNLTLPLFSNHIRFWLKIIEFYSWLFKMTLHSLFEKSIKSLESRGADLRWSEVERSFRHFFGPLITR